jgi:NADH-quinone oxidoreductase subunit H
MTALFQSWGASYEWAWFWSMIIGILIIALPLMLAVAMIIYADRKIWAAIALRRGPNVVGPWGLLQSFADGLKVFLKETIIPTSANKGLFLIAPIVTFTTALIVWAVIPFDLGVVLADVNVGLLYILAASSLGVYGVIVAGWASNSKYPFFSALRAAAQMVSYEVSIGFVLICVVLYANTFNLSGIVIAQQGNIGFGLLNGFGFNPLLFPMAIVFLISSMAETFRTPFDLVEAESELVAGHQTEYSSMSFALFWLGEYGNVILMCALNALIFWGGWLPPLNIDLIPWFDIPGILWLFAKMGFFFFVFSWVKATVPRYRYDQLMRLGWKIFLPLSLLFVVLISGWLMLTRYDTDVSFVGTAHAAPVSMERDVFSCSFVKNERSDPDSHIVDLRAERQATPNGDFWLLDFGNGPPVRGKAFDVSFGSIGGGAGIEWRDQNNKVHRAFVSYSDIVMENGQKAMFLSLDKPSLWQPPGYACQTAALKENRP